MDPEAPSDLQPSIDPNFPPPDLNQYTELYVHHGGLNLPIPIPNPSVVPLAAPEVMLMEVELAVVD